MKDNSDNEMTNIKNIYASGYCSYVLTNTNEVYAVGYNNYGQQFQNNTATNTKLTKIKTDVEITSIAVTTSQEYQAAAYCRKAIYFYVLCKLSGVYNSNSTKGVDVVKEAGLYGSCV